MIGLYPGSFNPFHKGHLNIVEKAEQIFDKVIIAFGWNPEKGDHIINIPNSLDNKTIYTYENSLVDFINSLPFEVTVIRGIRNSTDLQYEMNQYRWLTEMKPDLRMVSIFCDKEYEHISSSALKTIQKISPELYKKYIVE